MQKIFSRELFQEKTRKKANLVITNMKTLLILFIAASVLFPQSKIDDLRTDASKHMEAGKYGEAIDLLNRYISAKPQNPEGYNMRGLAYEKRGLYEMAVYDFRSARKLAPKNQEILSNLSRTTESWYKLLYNKIEGHKREIAIDASVPVNYLEIGKSYKNLGEWGAAEVWYDEYLKREEASPDEIIRYTEILAKNNHIAKGEPILKRYVEMYPDDQRLWSRYGYFTLWLGKKKIAIDAFEHALAIRPYFQEALDGLDMAKGKGYIYTINDTSYRYSRNQGMVPKKAPFEYPIDRYHRLLKKSPGDDDTRFRLVKELIKAGRYEEAFKELEFLSDKPKNKGKYDDYIANVKSKRDSLIELRVQNFIKKIEKNPSDKDAVTRLAVYYASLPDYEKALSVLSPYLRLQKEKDAADIRFMYAKYAAWDYRFRESLEQLDILQKYDPDNTEYHLLKGQILVWTDQEPSKADFYLSEVLNKKPDNLPALIASATLKIKQQEFAAAKGYIDRASVVSPGNDDVEAVRSNYEVNLASYELYRILYSARDEVDNNNCAAALKLYDEYLSKVPAAGRLEMVEYAGIYMCLEDYANAITVYNRLLEDEYDFDIAVLRGKAYLWNGDSALALAEFQRLSAENEEDFDANFFYGISLAANHKYGDAGDVYDRLLENTSDQQRIDLVNEAKSWLPKSMLFGGFPTYFALSPYFGFYDDSQAFTLNNAGVKLDFGITRWLGAGVSYSRIRLLSDDINRNLNTMKGNVYIKLTERLLFNFGIGRLKTRDVSGKNVFDAQLKYEIPDEFTGYLFYEENDARAVLYSPFIINHNLNSRMGKAGINYRGKSGLRASGHFSYLHISDKNEGNDFLLRAGKAFYKDFALGYEYQYLNYSKKSPLYWSPFNFDSHALWGEWNVMDQKEDDIKVNLGGRLGYISEGDFMIREISGELTYKPLPYFVLAGKITAGSTYRFDASYNYMSAMVSAYWNIY
jgi:Flp pilus assembly protein TadD